MPSSVIGSETSNAPRALPALRARCLAARASEKCAWLDHVPVQVGGIVVCPGDMVVGDDDGVVVVPRAMANAVLEKARIRDRKEREESRIGAGELPLDPSGAALSLDKLLAGKVIEHHELRSWGADGDTGIS
jgi:regulator of ribonuclease E activity RraA/HMG-CHA aldolase family protein